MLDKEAQGRLKKGRQALMLSHQETVRRRGISKKAYLFPLKIFSNFVHTSSISVRFTDDTGLAWNNCFHQFIQVLHYVSAYVAEALVCFVEGPAGIEELSNEISQLCTEYRKRLR